MWHYLDPAAIYNPIYEQLRSSVSELLSGSSSALDPKVCDFVLLLIIINVCSFACRLCILNKLFHWYLLFMKEFVKVMYAVCFHPSTLRR